jgi:transketolase
MAHRGHSVHVPCAFSIVELISVLYSKILKIKSISPSDPERDYFVLSKGHGVMALYACFHELGWLDRVHLDNYFQDGSLLRGLCEAGAPGLEVTGGSLGHGLPVAVGIAFGLKRRAQSQNVYCLVGDGELNEGTTWEAILFASHHKLDNLIIIVDANQFQAMGTTQSILNMEPLSPKFASLGVEVSECDGHNSAMIEQTLKQLNMSSGKPKALIARTIKGKGLAFMEGKNSWHYTRLSDSVFESALQELDQNA